MLRLPRVFKFAVLLMLVGVSSYSHARGFLPAVNYGTGTRPVSVVVADFNGDGRPDLCVLNSSSNSVTLFLGAGDGTFRTGRSFALSASPAAMAAGDLDRDGWSDLVVTNGNKVSILLNNNGKGFKPPLDYSSGISGPVSIGMADLNGDGKLDLAVANASGANVAVLIGNGDGTFQDAVDYDAGGNPESVAIGDLNGDGKPDLVVADFNFSGSVLLGNGDGTFQPATSFPLSGFAFFATLADLNNDGKLDLVISYSVHNITVLLGNGDGSFQAGTDYQVGTFPGSAVAADVNGDGNLDLVVAVSNAEHGSVTVLLGKGDGSFQSARQFGAELGAYGVAAADLNHDRAIDLAVANLSTNNVSVLMNSGGTFVATASSENPAPVGQSVTFTATVAPSLVQTIPTGKIAFADDATILATVPLDPSGQASFTTSSLSLGTHTIRTKYSGDPNFNPNMGKPITQIIQ